MRYLGGKVRQGKHIAEVIGPYLQDKVYIEPFCGAMGSATHVINWCSAHGIVPKRYILSDIQRCLMVTWECLLGGWIPPDTVSEEEYNVYKKRMDEYSPMTAYVGYGLAFAGKFFGTYARDKKKKMDFAKNAKKSTMARMEVLQGANVKLQCCDYSAYSRVHGCVFYLDPPYAGRTRQFAKNKFDHEQFWEFARELSANNLVFVTEFVAPDDFESIYDFGDTVVRHYSGKGKDGTVESIYRYVKGRKI